MSCNCIVDVYDFEITQDACDRIYYHDRSTWGKTEAGAKVGYTLKVTDPTGSVTSYQVIAGVPLKLELGNCAIPGVYDFEVESCDNFAKKYPIVCSLWCGWLKAVAKLGGAIDVSIITSIRERIEYILKVSSTDFNTARDLTETVIRDLKKINCECSCF